MISLGSNSRFFSFRVLVINDMQNDLIWKIFLNWLNSWFLTNFDSRLVRGLEQYLWLVSTTGRCVTQSTEVMEQGAVFDASECLLTQVQNPVPAVLLPLDQLWAATSGGLSRRGDDDDDDEWWCLWRRRRCVEVVVRCFWAAASSAAHSTQSIRSTALDAHGTHELPRSGGGGGGGLVRVYRAAAAAVGLLVGLSVVKLVRFVVEPSWTPPMTLTTAVPCWTRRNLLRRACFLSYNDATQATQRSRKYIETRTSYWCIDCKIRLLVQYVDSH